MDVDRRLRPFHTDDTDTVIALWERCGLTRPWNDPRLDIARTLTVQPELFLAAEHGGTGVGLGKRLISDAR